MHPARCGGRSAEATFDGWGVDKDGFRTRELDWTDFEKYPASDSLTKVPSNINNVAQGLSWLGSGRAKKRETE